MWNAGVLVSHKGLRASAPHSVPIILGSDVPKAHLSKCEPTKLSRCTVVLWQGRFASFVSSKALKMWRLRSWFFGPWSLLSKGDFERTRLPCPHLRLPGRAMRCSFSPGHGSKMNPKLQSCRCLKIPSNLQAICLANFESYPPFRTQK